MNRLTIPAIAICLTAPLVGASDVFAGGIGVPGYGSQAQPRAGAFAAKADDPSAIFHNPAGLAKLRGTVVQFGLNLVKFSQSFLREGSYDQCEFCADELPFAGQSYAKIHNRGHGRAHLGDFATIPLFSVSSDLGLDLPLVFAAGIFAPALGSPDREYDPDYKLEATPSEPPLPGRYDVMSQSVTVVQPSVAVAYRVNDNLDLGVRLSWGIANLQGETMTWGLRNYEEWEGTDVYYAIDADDNFVPSFGLGALYRPIDNIELGLNYRSASHIRAKGTAQVEPGSETFIDEVSPVTEGPLVCGPGGTADALVACLALDLPQIAAVAGRWIFRNPDGSERADIELDVQWENWSAASNTRNLIDARASALALPESVIRHGFKDVFSLRLGGSYTMPVGDNTVSVRGGLAYDTETAQESWTRLDQDGMARTTVGLGAAYDVPGSGWRFALSGGAVFEGKRTVSHNGCNPTSDDVGCEFDNRQTPVADRDAPDPVQPIQSANNQIQSPFNAGVYEQGYLLFSLGVTKSF